MSKTNRAYSSGSAIFKDGRDVEFPPRRDESPALSSASDRGESPLRQFLSSSASSLGSWRLGGGRRASSVSPARSAASVSSSHSSLSSLGAPAEFLGSSAASSLPSGQQPPNHYHRGGMKRREVLAWAVVAAQAVVIAAFSLGFGSPSSSSSSSSSTGAQGTADLRMNNRPNAYYERQRQRAQLSSPGSGSPSGGYNNNKDDDYSHWYGSQALSSGPASTEPYYDSPVFHPPDGPGFVERTWHSNGSPSINADLKKGSCWCSADEWCMCTPSMAVDVILRSGPDRVWMVRRVDTGKLALMGGMIEVGETAEQAVHRELREEMNVVLSPDNPPALFGVYSDPLRDARRHTASVVYVVDVPPNVAPRAGDDAADVVSVALDDIDHRTFFVDHKTMLRDYRAAVTNGAVVLGGGGGGAVFGKTEGGDDVATTSDAPLPLGPGGAAGSEVAPFSPGEPVRRSVCPIPVVRAAA